MANRNCVLNILKVLFILFISILVFNEACAFDIRKPSDTEIFLGYGGDKKLDNGNYEYYLAAIDFSYPLRKEGWMRNFSFQLEPFLAFVTSPDTNMEAGCSVYLKYSVPWNFALKPYIRGGTGVVYMSQDTREQATRFNFVDQLCYGIAYERRNVRISAEFRNRHISNLDIKEPNSGIDTKVWMLGITSFF
ncbi:MAG TPA: acyloxyacyl hydrolase [bacterium]|nr:acyloxyacyl hydrolase [bacterium]